MRVVKHHWPSVLPFCQTPIVSHVAFVPYSTRVPIRHLSIFASNFPKQNEKTSTIKIFQPCLHLILTNFERRDRWRRISIIASFGTTNRPIKGPLKIRPSGENSKTPSGHEQYNDSMYEVPTRNATRNLLFIDLEKSCEVINSMPFGRSSDS